METYLVNGHFVKFKKYVQKWKRFFGLADWQIEVHFDIEDENEENMLAYSTFILENRRADITLLGTWLDKTDPTEKNLNQIALHEVCEVLLAPIRILAQRRYVNYEEIDNAVHATIRKLENALLVKEKI